MLQGTRVLPVNHSLARAVQWALEAGYRHIDTASLYRVEDEVGLGVRDFLRNNVTQRRDVYITTKVSSDMSLFYALVATTSEWEIRAACGRPIWYYILCKSYDLTHIFTFFKQLLVLKSVNHSSRSSSVQLNNTSVLEYKLRIILFSRSMGFKITHLNFSF